MTMSQTWKIIRWPIAIIIMLIAAYTAYSSLDGAIKGTYELDISGSTLLGGGDDSGEPGERKPGKMPTGPVVSGKANAISDFAVVEGVVETGTEGVVLTEQPSSMILAFDGLPGNPDCFESLGVKLTVMEVTGTNIVGLFPSDVQRPKKPATGDQMRGDMQLSPNAMAVAAFGGVGTATIDILPNYKNWFELGRSANDPLTFTITAAEAIEPGNSVRIATSEVKDSKPELIWTGKEGCE